ncbi:MAG: MFS transporter [Methanobacteriota archaeon]|nr:MAG: MFS transporter [Euryarchaeota archaeon]
MEKRKSKTPVSEEERKAHRPLYANQTVSSLSNGLAMPYIPFYATRLGATSAELGWLQAFRNLFPNIMQLPWGSLSDRLKTRIPFLILGGWISSIMFLFIAFSVSPSLLILLVAVQSFAISMMIPTWSALLGEKVGKGHRGYVFSRIVMVSVAAALVGNLLTGVMVINGPPDATWVFQYPFIAAMILGILATVFLFRIPAKEPTKEEEEKVTEEEEWKRKRDFRYLVTFQLFYMFFMSMLWPLMPKTTVDIIGADNLEIVLLTVVGSVSILAVQMQIGRLQDRVGPGVLIKLSRFMLVPVPLVYAFATEMWHLYVLNIVAGAGIAIINISFTTYLLDVAPASKTARYFAIFNAGMGIVTFVGSVSAGYLADHFTVMYGLWTGLFIVYMVSTVGRLIGSIFFLKLKPSRRYPETLHDVLPRISRILHLGRGQ